MAWQQFLKSALIPRPSFVDFASLAPGLYHFPLERDGRYIRFHLRVDPGGYGILIAGAAEAVQLSKQETCIAARLLNGESMQQVSSDLGWVLSSKPLVQMQQLLDRLANPVGRLPILNVPDAFAETRLTLSAPFQADFAISSESDAEQIVERLWGAGVPHLRLVAEKRDDSRSLVHAVTWAEDRGMIAGIRMNAEHLLEDALLEELAKVGLDYVVLPWCGSDSLHGHIFGQQDLARIGECIQQVRRWEITPVLQVPLIAESFDLLDEGLRQVADWEIEHIEVYAIAESDATEKTTVQFHPILAVELRQMAAWMEDYANDHALQLIWLPPQALAGGQSVEDSMRRGPRAGGDVSIRVESNGDVILPRGPRWVAGNIIEMPFADIWQSEAVRRYREPVHQAARCEQCPVLAICAAGCPADTEEWAR